MAAIKTYQMRCPSCGASYLVRCPQKMALKSILGQGARCIETRTGALCGAPLQRAQSVFNNGRDAHSLDYTELLGYRVTKKGLLNDAQTTQAAAQAKQDYEQKIADLNSEVRRLKAKYETPCQGMVKHWDSPNHSHLVNCGGFMGHPGECAEVW